MLMSVTSVIDFGLPRIFNEVCFIASNIHTVLSRCSSRSLANPRSQKSYSRGGSPWFGNLSVPFAMSAKVISMGVAFL